MLHLHISQRNSMFYRNENILGTLCNSLLSDFHFLMGAKEGLQIVIKFKM